MKKKIIVPLLAVILVASGIGCSIANSSSEDTQRPEVVEDTEEERDYQPIAHVDEERVDKSETVVAKADANGKVEETTVSVVLKNPGGLSDIDDCSNLTNVKNIDGDEEYSQQGDRLLWQNHGKNISYKGNTDKALPVNVSIKYYLDGQEISPDALAGKSGHVKMSFKLTNITSEDGFVPFACITLVPLDEDAFYNVVSEDGTVKYMDGSVMVVGTTFPGLKEYLDIDEDQDSPIDFKDSFELEADTEGFKLEFTETIVTNGLLEGIDQDSLADYRDSASDMEKAGDATDKLDDGIKELKSGVTDFKAGIKTYTNGVDECAKGAKELEKGLKQLNKYASQLPAEMAASIKQLYKGSSELSKGLGRLSDSGKELVKGADSMLDVCDSMKSGVNKLKTEAFDKMADQGKDLKKLIDKLDQLKKAEKEYNNFSGLVDGKTSSVMFMIETAELEQ